MLSTAASKLEILWKVRSEHRYPANFRRIGIAPVAAAPGRTRLPAMRRRISAAHSILRPLRSDHGLTPEPDKRGGCPYNGSQNKLLSFLFPVHLNESLSNLPPYLRG